MAHCNTKRCYMYVHVRTYTTQFLSVNYVRTECIANCTAGPFPCWHIVRIYMYMYIVVLTYVHQCCRAGVPLWKINTGTHKYVFGDFGRTFVNFDRILSCYHKPWYIHVRTYMYTCTYVRMHMYIMYVCRGQPSGAGEVPAAAARLQLGPVSERQWWGGRGRGGQGLRRHSFMQQQQQLQ